MMTHGTMSASPAGPKACAASRRFAMTTTGQPATAIPIPTSELYSTLLWLS